MGQHGKAWLVNRADIRLQSGKRLPGYDVRCTCQWETVHGSRARLAPTGGQLRPGRPVGRGPFLNQRLTDGDLPERRRHRLAHLPECVSEVRFRGKLHHPHVRQSTGSLAELRAALPAGAAAGELQILQQSTIPLIAVSDQRAQERNQGCRPRRRPVLSMLPQPKPGRLRPGIPAATCPPLWIKPGPATSSYVGPLPVHRAAENAGCHLTSPRCAPQ
jgi:hypothetical protein